MRLIIFVLRQPHASHYRETSLKTRQRLGIPSRVTIACPQDVEMAGSLEVVLAEGSQTDPQGHLHRMNRSVVVLVL